MSQRLLLKVGKSRRQQVLQEIKRAGSTLAVRDLADKIGLSYMGTKEICQDLTRAGYLSVWREPVPRGRPRMLYRLTRKADELFTPESLSIALQILQAAAELYGSTAPGKLLLRYFQDLAKEAAGKIRGASAEERLRWLARWRDGLGHYATFQPGPPAVMLERHQPLRDIFSVYPEALAMELRLLESLVGCPLQRLGDPGQEGGPSGFQLAG